MHRHFNRYKNKVRKPNFFLYYFLLLGSFWILKLLLHIQVKNKEIIQKMNKPFILLFNHPSKLDFIYAYAPLWRHRINTMAAYYYFCQKNVGDLMHLVGAYPKTLFSPDLSAIKNTYKIVKRKGSIGISPEGRLSPHGAMESVHLSTAKLIQKMGVDVYCAHIHGSYFVFPKWAKNIRRGLIEIEYEHLFTSEILEKLELKEIENRLVQAMDYNEYAWQEKKQTRYKSNNLAKGLEYLLYRCPVCHEMYTLETNGNEISCSHCHTAFALDSKYYLHSQEKGPTTIKEWYEFQKEYERKNIPDDFSLRSPVVLKMPDKQGKGFIEVGRGMTTINAEELIYQGLLMGEETKISFPIKKIQTILFGPNEDFEVYHEDEFYYFVPENIKECVRYTILADVFYERVVK
ncbi:MAG: lysophospholipid acyltransferase family protein [Bacilli bacterium]|nr:lysophospholipid acyltransferase family protein [Bacilli bacterium]